MNSMKVKKGDKVQVIAGKDKGKQGTILRSVPTRNRARTLGWSNAKIFVRLMLPLSWSSIAAGAVLSFARALGEFGATLFLAGNYLGVTRTIPIAIYFEWMNGNDSVAWFWTAVIIAFSFVVILFINLWSSRTTKYRKREGN